MGQLSRGSRFGLWSAVALAVALLAGAYLAGQRSVTDSDPVRTIWLRATDSLLVRGRAADSARARQAGVIARLTATTDSLARRGAQLAAQVRARPALPPAETPGEFARDTIIVMQDTALVVTRLAYDGAIRVSDSLRLRMSVDSSRVLDLTRQLETIPKPPRPSWSLLGLHLRPCVFAGYSNAGAVVGVGGCVSR